MEALYKRWGQTRKAVTQVIADVERLRQLNRPLIWPDTNPAGMAGQDVTDSLPDHPAWIPPALPQILLVLTPKKDARPSGAAVAAIQHVNLPPFWPNSPSTWFLQVEVHFRLRQIISQQTRYWNLVSCLPPDVADDLADILASPHPSHPYDTLKAAIISRKSESEHSRLQQLITATELGDRRASQLLRRMRQLLGGPSAPQKERKCTRPCSWSEMRRPATDGAKWIMPQGVKRLFGNVAPSVGHGLRVCKILKAGWYRQARLRKQYLSALLFDRLDDTVVMQQLRQFQRLADQSTKFL
ncbi:hypothetical protein HPB51_003321 [Rhipicephalus microplus]|uniref:DUF7041 domain-containing protein n=1 Tax=Rhipicephalus microplus TaxID=6941 RepID=A0A9J6EWS1_RHIMP|nr:hypothetical protein HPB51_003321 [Rhipicephalus microplus]